MLATLQDCLRIFAHTNPTQALFACHFVMGRGILNRIAQRLAASCSLKVASTVTVGALHLTCIVTCPMSESFDAVVNILKVIRDDKQGSSNLRNILEESDKSIGMLMSLKRDSKSHDQNERDRIMLALAR